MEMTYKWCKKGWRRQLERNSWMVDEEEEGEGEREERWEPLRKSISIIPPSVVMSDKDKIQIRTSDESSFTSFSLLLGDSSKAKVSLDIQVIDVNDNVPSLIDPPAIVTIPQVSFLQNIRIYYWNTALYCHIVGKYER